MSERGWKFAEDWVAAHVHRETLGDPGELIDLSAKVAELKKKLFDDAMRADIAPVEIEEYYDLDNYIAGAVKRAQ